MYADVNIDIDTDIDVDVDIEKNIYIYLYTYRERYVCIYICRYVDIDMDIDTDVYVDVGLDPKRLTLLNSAAKTKTCQGPYERASASECFAIAAKARELSPGPITQSRKLHHKRTRPVGFVYVTQMLQVPKI